MQLHTKILLGLVLGAALGILANVTLGGAHPLVEGINHFVAGPIGQIFLNLLFMIVIPLVFASIALGVAGLGDLKRVGRIGARVRHDRKLGERGQSLCPRGRRRVHHDRRAHDPELPLTVVSSA